MTRDIVSIEKVLNSRCSSGFDISAEKRHWGTFINQHPPKKNIDRVLRCCNIPRFSNEKLTYWFQNGFLYLGFEKPTSPHIERILHIESGMQQEAIHLACTSLEIGTCIHNQGINGTRYGEKIATVKHLIMEISELYESGKFTAIVPGPKNPFLMGKILSKPMRDGETECLKHLENLTLFNKSDSSATEKDISQLLWAAKGRTPHQIRMHAWNAMWGLTIPTWGGGQDYTSIFLFKDRKLFHYINWTKKFSKLNRLFLSYAKWTRGNPTHDIQFIKKANICSQIDDADRAIILCQNENTSRALWEVGYMLENMFLQLKSLNISYESKVFKTEELSQLIDVGINNAVAAILL